MEKIKELVKNIVEQEGYILYDCLLEKEKGDLYLRVLVDHLDGVTIDDIVKVNHSISNMLDVEDPIEEEYFLEVMSPGAERELRTSEEIKRFIGYHVFVKTLVTTFEGELLSIKDNVVTIKENNRKKAQVDLMDVEIIRLAVKF